MDSDPRYHPQGIIERCFTLVSFVVELYTEDMRAIKLKLGFSNFDFWGNCICWNLEHRVDINFVVLHDLL